MGPFSRRLDLYHTPYHLYDFSPETMRRLLGQTGFEEIQTVVGGHTTPTARIGRWASVTSGKLAEAVEGISRGRILLPGVSKTTIARKGRGWSRGVNPPSRINL
jgi:hypothetical protein